jgi:hypothetical protein
MSGIYCSARSQPVVAIVNPVQLPCFTNFKTNVNNPTSTPSNQQRFRSPAAASSRRKPPGLTHHVLQTSLTLLAGPPTPFDPLLSAVVSDNRSTPYGKDPPVRTATSSSTYTPRLASNRSVQHEKISFVLGVAGRAGLAWLNVMQNLCKYPSLCPQAIRPGGFFSLSLSLFALASPLAVAQAKMYRRWLTGYELGSIVISKEHLCSEEQERFTVRVDPD